MVVGYAGGASARPTYENHEGHLEAIQVTYDPAQTSYSLLVANFFHRIDPTDPNGQRSATPGAVHRTAVFVDGAAERAAAEAVKAQVAKELGKPVATMILPAATFHMGEGYHQDYAKKNPMAYNAYRVGCGREAALKAVWQARLRRRVQASPSSRAQRSGDPGMT